MSRLTQDCYEPTNSDSQIPLRWTAIEVLKLITLDFSIMKFSFIYCKKVLNGESFTSKSDVWSFAVTVWEIFEYGVQPYIGMSNIEVVRYVRMERKRLEKPSNCPDNLYQLLYVFSFSWFSDLTFQM
jgi:hypothetical protein